MHTSSASNLPCSPAEPTGTAEPLSRAPRRRVAWLRGLVLASVLLCLFALRRELNLAQYFSRENLAATLTAVHTWVEGYGIWGPFAFIAVCAVATIVYFPIIIVVFLAVTLFGHVVGGLVSMVIIAAGSSLVHVIAHRLGRPVVERLMGRRMQAIEARISRRELVNVILLRLVLFMNPVLNWALGISGVRYRNVLLGTLIGVAPAVFLLTWLSGELIEFVQTGNARSLLEHPALLIPVILAFALFRGNWLFERFQKMHRS
ncbi:MAG: VTT domain-containing protein [bacterium]